MNTNTPPRTPGATHTPHGTRTTTPTREHTAHTYVSLLRNSDDLVITIQNTEKTYYVHRNNTFIEVIDKQYAAAHRNTDPEPSTLTRQIDETTLRTKIKTTRGIIKQTLITDLPERKQTMINTLINTTQT